MEFPAWDCLPYDRVSPNAGVVAQRMTALSRLARVKGRDKPSVLLTTVNAALAARAGARLRRDACACRSRRAMCIGMAGIVEWLELNGFTRASTVREPGEYAVRGGILDLFPPGMDMPVRLDFFGDALETIRTLRCADPDAAKGSCARLDLVPVAEFQLVTETIRRFRTGYVARVRRGDARRSALRSGERRPPLSRHGALAAAVPRQARDAVRLSAGHAVALEQLAEDAAHERLSQIADYYDARREALKRRRHAGLQAAAAGPALSDRSRNGRARLDGSRAGAADAVRRAGCENAIDVGARAGHNFTAERAEPGANVFEAVSKHVLALQAAGKRVAIALWSEGARERMSHVLADHKLAQSDAGRRLARGAGAAEARRSRSPCSASNPVSRPAMRRSSASRTFSATGWCGRAARPRRAENFIAEATSLAPGDLVVHVDHGIGRFAGLQAIEAAGAPHDCLEIHYAEGAKLYLPVENIDLLSRYGSEEADRRPRPAWRRQLAGAQGAHEEPHPRDRGRADQDRRRAAVARGAASDGGPGAYDEFCAGFPYEETDDQLAAIDATIKDLGSGRPMDRLICGDVGFGKTEVALRAAFVAAISGKQVAVVVPTTLLARQHFKTFSERFRGFPVNVAQASRLVPAAKLAKVRAGLADGSVDIVIGTHALLGKNVKFKDLALLVVDEEQHFGVTHKEKLKTLRAEVHVLTLTATPIPRTLQLALTGVRDLSIIASPPVDRLAVRTFVSPFDPVTVREALLREKYRGGQAFYVCPRIEDLAGGKDFLDKNVPEVRVAVAHGQMPPTAARRHHVGLLRRQIRRAALDHDHRIRPRYSDRQYADRASRRPLRPGAALSAARPGGPRETARLCAAHAAGAARRSRRRPSAG